MNSWIIKKKKKEKSIKTKPKKEEEERIKEISNKNIFSKVKTCKKKTIADDWVKDGEL